MLYKPPGAVYIASCKEWLDQSNSLFSSEIILIIDIKPLHQLLVFIAKISTDGKRSEQS